MKIFRMIRHFLNVLLLLSLISCSSGEDMLAGGGIGGTGVTSTGTITAIGSVWVNGVEFDTQNADVYVDDDNKGVGDQAIAENLSIGQVVRVSGRLNTDGAGQADAVFYSSTLTGPIDAIETIDPHEAILFILDQEVVVNSRTLTQGAAAGDLDVGNLVEISGFFDDEARIQASFLTKKADAALPGALLRLSGPVGNLNENEQTFLIHSRVIDYSQSDMNGFGSSGLKNGMFVRVDGVLENDGGAFKAQTLRPSGRLDESHAEKIEIEGIVGTDVSVNQFSLEGYPVEFGPDTKIVWGTREEILPGSRVEVEGEFVNGILVAETITFNALFMAESELIDKNDLDSTLTLRGMETLAISTDHLTRFKGNAREFEDLMTGDHLVLKGWIADDQTVWTAQILATSAANNKIGLRGMLTSLSDRILSINSVEIDARDIPSDGFYGTNGRPISIETFLGMIREGDWVEAKGQLSPDNSIEWQSLSLVLQQ